MTATDGAQPHPYHRGILLRAAVASGHLFGRAEPLLNLFLWILILNRGSLTGAAKVVVGSVLLTGVACEIIHDRRLCGRCMDALPLLDPQAAVDTHKAKLRLTHNRRAGLLLMAVTALPIAVALTPSHVWSTPAKIILAAVAGAGLVALTYTSHARKVHARLQPWCPWCRPGGGGPGEDTPAPTPDPAGVGERR